MAFLAIPNVDSESGQLTVCQFASMLSIIASLGSIVIGLLLVRQHRTKAKETAEVLGIPTVPGSAGALISLEEAINSCERIGYPVLIKAAAGGGGKGMKVVYSINELKQA